MQIPHKDMIELKQQTHRNSRSGYGIEKFQELMWCEGRNERTRSDSLILFGPNPTTLPGLLLPSERHEKNKKMNFRERHQRAKERMCRSERERFSGLKYRRLTVAIAVHHCHSPLSLSFTVAVHRRAAPSSLLEKKIVVH
ncbi:uncharacterized protein G2W53_001266 [Senna tora]|uniref:Uncharacterized protein n=1 Tax=Senna tora TaxID=362788 RepID=A0A835CIF7_9FABA|nr:uncharacterized protein G2W53_001266 [Senna tora]